MAISNAQLAELMVGMAKANVALVKAAANNDQAAVMRMIPAMQAASAVQAHTH